MDSALVHAHRLSVGSRVSCSAGKCHSVLCAYYNCRGGLCPSFPQVATADEQHRIILFSPLDPSAATTILSSRCQDAASLPRAPKWMEQRVRKKVNARYTQFKMKSKLNYPKHNYSKHCFSWLTWALLTTNTVSGLARNTTLGLFSLPITVGSDHYNIILADTSRALELTGLSRYLTVSPTLKQ